MGFPFIVQGARVICSKGNIDTVVNLKVPSGDARSKLGNNYYMLKTDTKFPNNFTGDFDTCKAPCNTTGKCTPDFLEEWHQNIAVKYSLGAIDVSIYYYQLDLLKENLKSAIDSIHKFYEAQNKWYKNFTKDKYFDPNILASLEKIDIVIESMTDGKTDLADLQKSIDNIKTLCSEDTLNNLFGNDKAKWKDEDLLTQIDESIKKAEENLKNAKEQFNQINTPMNITEPLDLNSFLVCKKGGIVKIITTGQTADILKTLDDTPEASLTFDPFGFNPDDKAAGSLGRIATVIDEKFINIAYGLQRSIAIYLGLDFSGYFKAIGSSRPNQKVLDFLEKKIIMIPCAPISLTTITKKIGGVYPKDYGLNGTYIDLFNNWNTIHSKAVSLKVVAFEAHGNTDIIRLTQGNIPSIIKGASTSANDYRLTSSNIEALLRNGPPIEKVFFGPCHNGRLLSNSTHASHGVSPAPPIVNIADQTATSLGIPCIAADGYTYPSAVIPVSGGHPTSASYIVNQYLEDPAEDSSGNPIMELDSLGNPTTTQAVKITYIPSSGFVGYGGKSGFLANLLSTKTTSSDIIGFDYIKNIDPYPGNVGLQVTADALLLTYK